MSVDGWSVQYHPSGATGTWAVTPLSGSISPGAFYLIGEGQGAGGTTTPLPPTQASGTIAMSGTGGVGALVNSATAPTCADSATCVAASVDLVGYGTAVINEGAPIAGASNTFSVQRSSAADTDNNATDFAAAAPTPGEAVTNVPGIVTGKRSNGFWIQDPTPDANPATSEGVFVFGPTTAIVGHSVLVSGTVRDFYPLSSGETVSSTSNLSVTEIGTPPTRPTSPAATSSRRRSNRPGPRWTSGSRARACASRSMTRGWSARRTTSASTT